MLSSLNTNNQNIFIPKYTIAKKTESNYISNLNTNSKHVKKICKNKKRIFKNNIQKNKGENKPIDFIINHGVLIYQRNLKGEEIINYGINEDKANKNKNINMNNKKNKILYRAGSNYNQNKIKKYNSKRSINTTRTTTDFNLTSKNDILTKQFLFSNTLDNYYNKHNIENSNINSNRNNNIISNNKDKNSKILKKNNTNYIFRKYKKNISQINLDINNKIIILYTKLKKIIIKKLKNIFLFLKFILYQNNGKKQDNKENILMKKEFKSKINQLINHKKSESITVNKRVSSNLSNLIPKNFKFFTKENEEPELYRDSKSLEKKYEQICRRKKLNLTMTFMGNFKQKNILNETNNYFSERDNHNSFSCFNYNNNIKNIINKKHCKNSPSLFNNSTYSEINAITDSANSITENDNYKIKFLENNNKDKNIFSYRIDKNPIMRNKNISYNFSNSDIISKDENSNNYEIMNKRISLSKNYFKKEKNKSNEKIKKFLKKDKNNFDEKQFHIVKNIITKDKRIYISINYLPIITPIDKNLNKNIKFNISKIFYFNYTPNNKICKRINKRKNELKQKLSLIKEEEEKNSSIKLIRKKNNTKIFKISALKLVNILEKNIYLRKYEFFFKLNKLLEKRKKIELGKDKIFLNRFFFNDNKNLFSSRSLDFGKEFKILDSSSLKKFKNGACSKDNITYKNK